MKDRVEYWDCIRGLAMVLVVFCHVCGPFCMNCSTSMISTDIADALMLPLFFFVSGRFSSIILSWNSFCRRFLSLFIPTSIMFLLYQGIRMHGYSNLYESLQGEYKSGYWFPYALLLMNFIHTFLSCIFSRKEKILLVELVLFVFIIYWIELYDWHYQGAFLSRWLSLRLIASYYPFYVMGVLQNKLLGKFSSYASNDWIIGISLLSFIGMFFVPSLGFWGGITRCFFGVIFIYCFFVKNKDFFSSKTTLGRQLSLIGRFTLPIYLIHYFILLGMKMHWIGEFVNSSNQYIYTLLGFILTIVVVYSSLGIYYLGSRSTNLSKWVLGK